MSGFKDFKFPERQAMSVFSGENSTGQVSPQDFGHGASHRGRGLPCTKNPYFPIGIQIDRPVAQVQDIFIAPEMRANGSLRVDGTERRGPDANGIRTKHPVRFHGAPRFGLFRFRKILSYRSTNTLTTCGSNCDGEQRDNSLRASCGDRGRR